jgi:probable rRNA maturation factor
LIDEIRVHAQVAGSSAPPVPLSELEDVVRFVLAEEDVSAAEISVTLLNDDEISRLNRDYLGHEGPTDVITFPLEGPVVTVVGDVYIGVEQAARQADELGISIRDELLRLAVHGTLHVLGNDHPTGDDRETASMYLRQEELLRLFEDRKGAG